MKCRKACFQVIDYFPRIKKNKKMINWRDCIVPIKHISKRRYQETENRTHDIYVWVAYQNTSPYLPIACEDNSFDLAQKVGVSDSVIRSCWCKYQNGETKRSRYHRVKIC